MKKSIKSYLVFTSCSYRIWGLAIVPLLLTGVTVWSVFGIKLSSTHLYGVASYVLAFEIFSDYWVFGGICEKQIRKLEYLKTSLRGNGILRAGLVMDLIRRAIYIILFSVICYAGNGQVQCFIMGAEIYLLAVIALNISRYLTSIQQQLVVVMLSVLPMCLLSFVEQWRMEHLPGDTYMITLELVVLIVVAVIASIVTVWHAMYRCSKVKGSYYEKGSDERN